MQNKNATIDIVNEVLEACIIAYPVSPFIISLYKQYQNRGSLSKKQLEGLHSKASKIPDITPGKLATLEAMIKRMPNRYKSEIAEQRPIEEKSDDTGDLITSILSKYPQHKRVLFLQSKFENGDLLSSAEVSDLKRLQQLLKL